MARIFLFIGAFLFPVILVPLALHYGPVGLGIIAMSVMGMSLVLYTKLVLKEMKPPEKRLYLIGCTMLAGGVFLLLQQMLFA
ncbi:MAG TPA: hypothetical protein VIG33_02950 [Pseudobdellovibrionaceae bacterium]|jgi:O-antigen/teichoic acid export membrane protein